MYKNVHEKIAQLGLFRLSELPIVEVPSKKLHNHDRKFENYLTRFIVKTKRMK